MYSAPKPVYGPPQKFKPIYGPPRPTFRPLRPPIYRPPKPVYGPPKPVYGPPNYRPPKPIYGPPPASNYGPPIDGLKPTDTPKPPHVIIEGSYGPPEYIYRPKPVYGPPQPTYGEPSLTDEDLKPILETVLADDLPPERPIYQPPSTSYGTPHNEIPSWYPSNEYGPPHVKELEPQPTSFSHTPNNYVSNGAPHKYEIPGGFGDYPLEYDSQSASYNTHGALNSYGELVSPHSFLPVDHKQPFNRCFGPNNCKDPLTGEESQNYVKFQNNEPPPIFFTHKNETTTQVPNHNYNGQGIEEESVIKTITKQKNNLQNTKNRYKT